MSKTIWKFPLKTQDVQFIVMPQGAEILTVQTQFGIPCIWALVDESKPKVEKAIQIFGTGHDVDGDLTQADYIGTYQLQEGGFIGHVFMKR